MLVEEGHLQLTESDIEEAEKRLGFSLPQDLRTFFLRYNGGVPDTPFFLSGDQGFLISRLLPLKNTRDESGWDIVRAFKTWSVVGQSDVLAAALPIADDWCGNFLLYSLDPRSLGTIFGVKQDEDPPGNIFRLCGNLTQFVQELQPAPGS